MSALAFVSPTAAQAELLALAGAISPKNYQAARDLIADKPEPRP